MNAMVDRWYGLIEDCDGASACLLLLLVAAAGGPPAMALVSARHFRELCAANFIV